MRSHPGADPTNDRRPSAVTGGYIGSGFGLLAVLSVASEIESPTPGDAAPDCADLHDCGLPLRMAAPAGPGPAL